MKKLALLCVTGCALVFCGCDSGAGNALALTFPIENSITVSDDFAGDQSAWKGKEGKWNFAHGVLRQTSTDDSFPLTLRMDQQYSDLDISIDFKPVSGRIDASGGLIFRAVDKDNYYIVRANALENNFRLYIFENGNRHQIASTRVKAPKLGKFHRIRVVAKGDHIQAYLNGVLCLDHHDTSYSRGFIGLWTKADSVTDFDNLHITGVFAE